MGNTKEQLQKMEEAAGFNKTQTCFYFINQTNLSDMEIFIINYILNFNQNERGCGAQHSTIAKAGGYKTKSVESKISKLAHLGLIERGRQVHHPDKKGSRNLNGLWVSLPKLFSLYEQCNPVT